LLTLLALIALTCAGRDGARADRLDGWWLRVRFSLREKLQTPRPDPAIVLVEIDDRSLARWPEPIIAWGGHLADAVEQMRAGGARVIALDWIQPEPTAKYFGPQFA